MAHIDISVYLTNALGSQTLLCVAGISKLKVTDKVTVNMSLGEFRKVQEDAKVPNGWQDSMKQVRD